MLRALPWKILLCFNSVLLFTFFTFLPFYLFNVRNQDILINLTIVLMGSKPERYRHQLARSVLTLRHIAQHCRSVLVLILAAHLLENDVAFHHLSVLTFLTLYSESLALLHHSRYYVHNLLLQDLAFLSRLISSNSDLAESWCKDKKSLNALEQLVEESPLIFPLLFSFCLFQLSFKDIFHHDKQADCSIGATGNTPIIFLIN